MEKSINRISTDSIRDIEDVKAWARDQEIRVDQRFEQTQAAISELRESDIEQTRGITRNMKMLLVATAGFGAVLAVVVLLFGIKQIIGSL